MKKYEYVTMGSEKVVASEVTHFQKCQQDKCMASIVDDKGKFTGCSKHSYLKESNGKV
jgi:hypothetical protein